MRYWSGEEEMTIYRVILPTTLKWFGVPMWNSDTFTKILKIIVIGHGRISFSALSRTQPYERWKMFSDSWHWDIFDFQQCDSWDSYHRHDGLSSPTLLRTQQYENVHNNMKDVQWFLTWMQVLIPTNVDHNITNIPCKFKLFLVYIIQFLHCIWLYDKVNF